MAIIIDAYNVLHCTHILPDRYAMMEVGGMCDLLSRSRWRRGRMVVVCDGTVPRFGIGEHDDVHLIYAGGGKDADSVIEGLIEKDTGPRDLVVVSNDRRIQRAARKRRASVMSSEDFLLGLVGSDGGGDVGDGCGKPIDVESVQVDYWVDKFQVGEEMGDVVGEWHGECGGECSKTGSESGVETVGNESKNGSVSEKEGGVGHGREKRRGMMSGRGDEDTTEYWLREFGLDDDEDGGEVDGGDSDEDE